MQNTLTFARPTLHLISLGCTKNLVDSEVMLGELAHCEMIDAPSEADIIIINTCGFIQSAKQESISTILRAAQTRKEGAMLVVSGCLSERYAKELEEQMPEIDIIIGVRDYDKINTLLKEKGFYTPRFRAVDSAKMSAGGALGAPKMPNIAGVAGKKSGADFGEVDSSKADSNKIDYGKADSAPDKISDSTPESKHAPNQNTTRATQAIQSAQTPSAAQHHAIMSSHDKVFLADETSKRIISNSSIHAYIKLSEGCNQRCSFCSIPSFKGKLQSRPIDSVLKEVENLAKRGFRDFSFIAQDSSSYLLDFGVKDGLVALIKALDSQGAAQNARIHYLYPTTTSAKLIETIIHSRIVQNYFDVPIQHIADSMLARMRRGMGEKELRDMLTLMRQAPDAFLRSTIIVGHPGESEEEFGALYDFVQEGVFDRLNIFAFSSEEGTSAHKMAQKIPAKTANKRISALNKLLKAQDKARYNALKGQKLEVIVEGRSSVSEYLYSARDRRWGLEIDGEILINDSEVENLAAGFYEAEICEYKNRMLFGKILRAL
ncbi:hypothetical protein BKN38_07020 [Helicobacter sp. CLO-3]|uniref:MiaB/RimO family radical SAM methylthiotransferase n=1 Tax=unclassified Helicobacter TaxID=2593540 RepID=UPI0008055AC4|nr:MULTISPECIES: radical SAM protein [unclassified Helicobacter]OBV28601.1 hypothetical protein BA723_01645 [Helicobacter sp. CLO-3]OHU82518.1 hypothetical protein BKN38_07020 [Helicobacter sp. CLO-3]